MKIGDLEERFDVDGKEIFRDWSKWIYSFGQNVDKKRYPELYRICKKLPNTSTNIGGEYTPAYVVRAKL